MTQEPMVETIERVNSRLRQLLKNAQAALCGEGMFAVTDVRALRALLAEMAPIASQAAELRRNLPEINAPLDLYRSQLITLQKAVERLRIMLLLQRDELEAGRTQLCAASQWFDAFQKTR